MSQILDEDGMMRALTRISYEIIERNGGGEDLVILGILSRGKELAALIGEKVSQHAGVSVPIGVLDIGPFRDDKKAEGLPDRSLIPFSLGDKVVILVDDVLFTGRSARAAIDGVMRHGRPKRIQLAVLIDRGHRELPIRPDFVGKNLPTAKSESVRVFVRERDGKNGVVLSKADEKNQTDNMD